MPTAKSTMDVKNEACTALAAALLDEHPHIANMKVDAFARWAEGHAAVRAVATGNWLTVLWLKVQTEHLERAFRVEQPDDADDADDADEEDEEEDEDEEDEDEDEDEEDEQ